MADLFWQTLLVNQAVFPVAAPLVRALLTLALPIVERMQSCKSSQDFCHVIWKTLSIFVSPLVLLESLVLSAPWHRKRNR